MAEDPNTPAYQEQLAHLNEDQGPATITGAGIMMFLCIIATIGRFMAQYIVRRGLCIDDWMILAALIINIGLCISLILCVRYGLGRHIVRLEREDPNLYADLINVFKNGYTMSVASIPALYLIKMSLVIYYRRIFTTTNTKVKYALWIVASYITAVFIASFVVFVYQCDPIPYFWLRAYALAGKKPPISGTCLDSLLHQVVPGAFNAFADLLILLLPGLALWPLQMANKKKAGLFFVFSLGAFVVGCSIVKIVFAVKVSNSKDSTYINTGILLWTVVESCIGQVCACIPCMMPLGLIFRVGPRAALKYGKAGIKDREDSYTLPTMPARLGRSKRTTGLYSQRLRSIDSKSMTTAEEEAEFARNMKIVTGSGISGSPPDAVAVSTNIGATTPGERIIGLAVTDNAIHVDSEVRWTTETARHV